MVKIRTVQPTIDPEDCPKRFKFPALYAAQFGGGRLFWQISFDGECNMIMKHGHEGGVITTSSREIVPKAGRNMIQQALLQMSKKHADKQCKKPYYSPNIFEPSRVSHKMMKGNRYEEGKTRLNYPVFVQPKLDGVRICFVRGGEGGCTAYTYQGKVKDNLDHVKIHAMKLFSLLPGNCDMIDGELLHREGAPLCDIISIFNTSKTVHDDIGKLYYAIFDLRMIDTTYNIRLKTLQAALHHYRRMYPIKLERMIRSVPTRRIYDPDTLKKYHDKILDRSYHGSEIEGIMIKKSANGGTKGTTAWKASLYTETRTSNIMKWKYFMDDEFEIIGATAGKGGHDGAIIFRLVTKSGGEFKATPKMTLEERRRLYKIRNRLVGKMATVVYRTLNKYGTPVHANVKIIRDYE